MKRLNPIFEGRRAGIPIQEGLFFLACFFILLFQIRPALVLEEQPQVFFKGFRFLKENLQIPGGLVDWFSSLLQQFWFSDWAGALCLVLCFWTVASLTRRWMRTIFTDRPIRTIHLIPAAFLLVLHGSTVFRLSVCLALAVNLAALIAFIERAPKAQSFKAQAARMLAGLAAMVLLYWFTGGAFYFFAVLLGFYDILPGKRIISGIILLAASGILPAAACASVFLVPLRQAFVHNLPFENPFRIRFIGYGIPAFYIIVQGCGAFMKSPSAKKTAAAPKGRVRVWKPAVWALLLSGAVFTVSRATLDETVRSVSSLNRSVRKERWPDALESSRRCRSANPLITFQTNLALFETGRLLDKMFAYPQPYGPDGLLMNMEWCSAFPEEAGNLYWKLGLISEAQHWTHEAFEQKGATADILMRLGAIYMLKGNPGAAGRFLENLKNVPFQGDTARKLMHLNENPEDLAQNEMLMRAASCMPSRDDITLGEPSKRQFEILLGRNRKNRMAFEYLVAHFLLAGDLNMVRKGMMYFYGLAYPQIPVHVQEALLLQTALERKLDPGRLKTWLDPSVFKRFIAYQEVLRGHRGNTAAARRELQASFGDTYWYYLMYKKYASRRPEQQHDTR